MKRIRSRIWLYMLLLVLLMLVVVWLLQVTFLQEFYRFYKAREVKKIQVEMVEEFDRKVNVEAAYRSILDIAEENEMFVAIYDKNAQTVLTPFMFEKMDIRTLRYISPILEEYRAVLTDAIKYMENEKTGQYIRYSKDETGENESVSVVSRIIAKDGEYYIFSRSPLAPVKATTDILKRNYIMILIIGFLVSALSAFLAAEYISRPIHALSKGAKAVAGGDLEYVVPEAEDDSEMSVLIKDFNHMTKELSKTDNLRRDLIANVSHELRTPLTTIKGYAETIRDLTGDNPEKRERQLDIIVDETDRLTELISALLDLSKLQADKVTFKSEEFDFSDTVEKVFRQYEYYEDNGYKITLSADENVKVTGDEGRLEQVLHNLIDNAVNHCGEEREIEIKLTGGQVPRFSVKNSGEPISEEDLSHIWERFYHTDKSGKRRVAGTGIGLSIVQEILEHHGFKYGVFSNENGTEFWFIPKKV